MNRHSKAARTASARAAKTNFTADELQHLSRLVTIGELSASFAHEITNPLTLIRGHLDFVQQSLAAGDPVRMNCEAIDRASRRIEEMSKWMLDFSRKRTPQTEKLDVAELISDATHLLQPYFRNQRIGLQIQLEPALPPIRIDRWQMVQAIVNVLQNAVDAMTGLDLDKRILSITAAIERNQMRIAISDRGTGITPANLPFIFDPFFTTKGERGSGLGLYVTKHVIDEHRGAITVQTAEGGTTFIIRIPL